MAKMWRQVLERAEAEHVKKMEWEEAHPPITLISKQNADGKREIQPVGNDAVTCNLPCHGDCIPREYSHEKGMVNVFNRGISVEGYEDPEEGSASYFATTCDLTDGKLCVATDEILRRAIER